MAAGRLNVLKVKNLIRTGRYGDGNGLYLQVSVTGTKAWLFRYMRQGKAHGMGLGSATLVSLAEARTRAIECRRRLADGLDPLAERKGARSPATAGHTFAEVTALYLAAHEHGWRNPKHKQQWRNTLDTYAMPILGPMPVDAITTSDVLRVLQPIWHEKTETASRLRGRVEAILSYGKALGWRQGENPARWKDNLAPLLPAKGRIAQPDHHAALAWRDMPAFMQALRQRDGAAASALELLILTAARTSEVLQARWVEFDLDQGLWTVPAERMKGKRIHRVPLSPAAVALLKRLPTDDPAGFLFPGAKAGKPLSNMALLMLLRRMDRGDLTGHGFRSAFRDWAAEATDHPTEVAEMALAHAVPDKVEAAYRRGDMFQKRIRIMADWAAFSTAAVPEPQRMTG